MEVLRTKHLEARAPSESSLDIYPDQPQELVPVDDTVMEIAGRLPGGDGPGDTDSVRLQHWLLIFGEASRELRLKVAEFSECLAKRRPPWDA